MMDQGRSSEAEVLLRSAAEGLLYRLGPQHPDSVRGLEALEQLQGKLRVRPNVGDVSAMPSGEGDPPEGGAGTGMKSRT